MSGSTGAAGIGYLDYEAKPSPAAPRPSQLPEASCRQWAKFGSCDGGHLVAKSIACGREWCPDCGQLDSDAHKRRWVRWLPKALQIKSMGYLVITFPVERRQYMRKKEELTHVAAVIKAALIDFGFVRGLRRWHYFGECPVHPKRDRDAEPCRCPRGYHPHLNFLVEGGFLNKTRLAELKKVVYKALGMKVVMHYQFTEQPAKMMHLLKYVTRPTFLDRTWDSELADNLYMHRTTQSWGTWKDEAVWKLEETEETIPAQVIAISLGLCPYCAGPLHYSRGVGSKKILDLYGYEAFGMSYFGKSDVPPDVVEYRHLAT